MGMIFVSYSHEDEKWREEVERQLRALKPQIEIKVWSDQQIGVGENWKAEIESAINQATVAVLLVSADLLGSDFIIHEEVPLILKKEKQGGLRILPIIVRFCPWKEVPWLKDLQVWPRDTTPLQTMTKPQVEDSLSSFATNVTELLAPKRHLPPRERIDEYISKESVRVWKKYSFKKPYKWNLAALSIDCTRNRNRQRDDKVMSSSKLWEKEDRLVLLLGPPACGKTTYCRRLRARPPKGMIPVTIGPNLPCTANEALKLLGDSADVHDEEFLRDLESEGNLIFIVDGIGEQGRKAQRIVKSLDQLAKELKHSRFLVTCRTGDWPKDQLWLPEFVKWFILDLDQDGWNSFLDDQEPGLQERMNNALKEQSALRELCSNQFLFLIAASVLAKQEGPSAKVTRVGLYDRFLDEFLAEWEKLTPIARAAVVRCLQDLAVEMRISGEVRTELSYDNTEDVLRRWLLPNASQREVEKALGQLYSIGLLEESSGSIRFFQETFQEYLCAKWLTERFCSIPMDDELWSFSEEMFQLMKQKGS